MLIVAGSVGLGLVWGWAAARLIHRSRWTVAVRTLLGLVIQGLVVLALATPPDLLAFAGAVALGALLGALWLRRLESRYG